MSSAFVTVNKRSEGRIKETEDGFVGSWKRSDSYARSPSPLSCEPHFLYPTTPRPQYYPSKVSPAHDKTVKASVEWMTQSPLAAAVVMPRKVSWGSMDIVEEHTQSAMSDETDDETSWYDLNRVAAPPLPDLDDSPMSRKPLLMRKSHHSEGLMDLDFFHADKPL
jgi:hypothetical protein